MCKRSIIHSLDVGEIHEFLIEINLIFHIWLYGLWCLTPLSTIFFSSIVAILVEETRVHREKNRPAASH